MQLTWESPEARGEHSCHWKPSPPHRPPVCRCVDGRRMVCQLLEGRRGALSLGPSRCPLTEGGMAAQRRGWPPQPVAWLGGVLVPIPADVPLPRCPSHEGRLLEAESEESGSGSKQHGPGHGLPHSRAMPALDLLARALRTLPWAQLYVALFWDSLLDTCTFDRGVGRRNAAETVCHA